MLHFSSNLEYYIKTRAIQSICNEMNSKLHELSSNAKVGGEAI
jgi:hypothetical protein